MREEGHIYLTVKQIVDNPAYPFTHGQMRMFLANREENYLQDCIRVIGRRIYFRKDLFDQWIEGHSDV